ncbi:MAG: hypothetical protein C4523_01790 [Myxococcales bacterium]|nr:MAG: hypothetical protein C4523_01790 [Myxococcales bacterium]
MKMQRASLLLLCLAANLLYACAEDASSRCSATCAGAEDCAAAENKPFSAPTCNQTCAENWEKIATGGCQEICQPEIGCLLEALDESCRARDLSSAALLCEPAGESCLDCIQDGGLRLTLEDLTYGDAFGGQCDDYCFKLGRCDASGKFTDESLETCLNACGEPERQTAPAEEYFACAEKEACEDFFDCLRDAATETDGDTDEPSETDGDPTESDQPACEESCVWGRDTSYCLEGDTCVCNYGVWQYIDCEEICFVEDLDSLGCGWNEAYGFDYCLCGDLEPTEEFWTPSFR